VKRVLLAAVSTALYPVPSPCAYPVAHALVGFSHERPCGGDAGAPPLADSLSPRTPLTLTAAICTRNRADLLERSLASLVAQRPAPDEVLVIDNAPDSDAAREVVERLGAGARCVIEPRPGLDFARNRALVEARSEVLAFLDDDAVASPGWAQALRARFESDPALGACTGRVEALALDTEAQRLFEENGGYSKGVERARLPDDARRRLHGHRAPMIAWIVWFGIGCNMAVRVSAARAVGGFDEALGIPGVLAGGDDLDMLWRILRAGHAVGYEPNALAWHEHRPDLLSMERQMAGHTRGLVAFLVKSALAARGRTRLAILAYIGWRLAKPAVRLARRAVRADPLPAMLHLRVGLNAWAGLVAYPRALRVARRTAPATRERDRLETRHPAPTDGGAAQACGRAAPIPGRSMQAARPRRGIRSMSGPGDAGDARRVLLLAPQPFYQDRGTPIAVWHVLDALGALGYEVDVLTFPLGRDLTLPGIRVHRISNPFGFRQVPIGFSIRKFALDVLLAGNAWSRLRAHRYDAIHAVEESAFFAVLLGRLHGIPVLYDMQSSLPEQLTRHRPLRAPLAQRGLRALERWLLRRAAVTACSAGLGPLVRESHPGAVVHEWHFPSAAPSPSAASVQALRERLGLAPVAPIVLYTGNLEPYQGFDLLLECAERLIADHPRVVFVVVGATEQDAGALHERGQGLVAREHLVMVPRQPREAMGEFLALADVVVSPRSYGGNLPLKIFDYLAAGKPIVASDLPVHRSVLDETRALLVEPSAAGFARAVGDLLDEPEQARALGEAAARYARTRLTRDAFRDDVRALYANVLAGAPRPARG